MRKNDVANFHHLCRVAIILCFCPHQRRRCIGAPAYITNAGTHGVVAGRQSFFQRQLGNGVDDLAQQVAYFDAPRERSRCHHVGIWPFQRLCKQHFAIWRNTQSDEAVGATDHRDLAVQIDDGRLHQRVVVKHTRVIFILQQILQGTHLPLTGTGNSILAIGAGRQRNQWWRGALIDRTQTHQQRFTIWHPREAATVHGIEGRG